MQASFDGPQFLDFVPWLLKHVFMVCNVDSVQQSFVIVTCCTAEIVCGNEG